MPDNTMASLSSADYHADNIGEAMPSLSQSIANILLSRSPLHAWQAHPRLGGGLRDQETSFALDIGNIVHSMLLGGGAEYVAIDADDWRKKETQKRRDEVRETGSIPILARQLDECLEIAAAATKRIYAEAGGSLSGERELVVKWHHDGVLCKGRLDLCDSAAALITDIKTCQSLSRSANGAAVVKLGYDVQSGAYIQAVETLNPALAGRVRYRWIFVETLPPYDAAVAWPSGEMLALGDRRWNRAVTTWGECLRTGRWPGTRIANPVEPPAWALMNDLTEEIANEEREDPSGQNV